MNLELVRGDITQQKVDAVVNAASAGLSGGGGVDGAIHKAGGPTIMEECRAYRGCPVGQAVITGAGRLPARYVIHTVGPVWQGGQDGESVLLESAYRNSLLLARQEGLRSLAFPSISTGAFGYPTRLAARVALTTVQEFLLEYPDLQVRFVLFSDKDLAIYQEELGKLECL